MITVRLRWFPLLGLILAAGALLLTACPESSPVEVELPPEYLVIFGTDAFYTGDLGGREGADRRVSIDPACPEGLTNIHALLSVTEEDCLKNMAATYGYPTDVPVVVRYTHRTTGEEILFPLADRWEDLCDGTLRISLGDAGILPDDKSGLWWSGSAPDGTLSAYGSCEGWTKAEDGITGAAGVGYARDEEWLEVWKFSSEEAFRLLGLGVVRSAETGYVPVTGISLDTATLSMVPGETHPFTVTVEPENATIRDYSFNIRWGVLGEGLSAPPPFSNEAAILDPRSGVLTAGVAHIFTVDVISGDGECTASCAVTVENPEKLIFFGTGESYTADLGGRGGADEKVRTDANRPAGTRVAHAFLSINDYDEVRDMPQCYWVPRDVPIYGPDGTTLVADNWDDLFKEKSEGKYLKASLLYAGLFLAKMDLRFAPTGAVPTLPELLRIRPLTFLKIGSDP